MTLKIYDDLIQGTDEWLEARRGILTASTIGQLITPSRRQTASNDKSRALVTQLVTERITGETEPVYVSRDMERGTYFEPFARDLYAEHYAPVQEVGFMIRTIDGNRLGYSPDGLVGDDGLIEIKCPRPSNHVRTIIGNEVPIYNMAQVQTGLLVTGREWADFISYSPGLPLFVKRVTPDEGWHTAITKTLDHFEQQAAETLTTYANNATGLHPTEPQQDPFQEIELKL